MNKWWIVVFVLIGLYIIGAIFAVFSFGFNGGPSFGNQIVVVPIEGMLTTSSPQSFFGSGGVASSSDIVKDIEELEKDDSVKGIIFEIDSPGGTVVASQEIADAIKAMNKTNYAVIREVGASGAYWAASATDKIVASPMSITGSIGVYGSYLEFSGLFDKYGVGYERLVGGKYKDVGVPYRELTNDERELLQGKLDLVHEFFIQEVASNRNMNVDSVRNVSTGEFFLGQEAKELGLVDELGNRNTAVELMKQELNLTDVEIVERRFEPSFFDILSGNVAYQFGRGFGSVVTDYSLNNRLEIMA